MSRSISTKTGDDGTTGLLNGIRAAKDNSRIVDIGDVDELTSYLGLARSVCFDSEVNELLQSIQEMLFKINSCLADSSGLTELHRKPSILLTNLVNMYEKQEGIYKGWSMPGGTQLSATLDVARAVCRRAERSVITLQRAEDNVDKEILAYLNRLSDLLWILGRWTDLKLGITTKHKIKE